MTLTELRYAVALAETRHFGRAASACFISQPTLSIAVKRLEATLAVTLFERGSAEVTLTEAGERLIPQARRVLEEAAALKAMAGTLNNPLVGALRLGVIFTIAPYLLPCLIPAVRRLAPDMPLLLEENYTDTLVDKLKQGELDAIIVADLLDLPSTLTYPLYQEPFVVVTPHDHPWAGRTMIPPADLATESVLLLTEGNCFRDHVLALCDRLNPPAPRKQGLAHSLQGGSLTTIRHMVASGVGVTVMPATAIAPTGEPLLAVMPFSGPVPTRAVTLLCRKHFYRHAAIARLVQAVKESGLKGVSFFGE